jgi:hydrogenase-4 component B
MPPPGDTRPARLTVHMTDPIWDWLYAPLASAIGAAADRLNRLQFLTIRQFLTLVFCALVILLLVLAVWS